MALDEPRIRMAVQKSGRLTDKSVELLTRAGLRFEWAKDRLFCRADNFPCDLMFLRDDDIPEYVKDGVCDLGLVGLNVLEEKLLQCGDGRGTRTLKRMGFGQCRLSLAVPNGFEYEGPSSLDGLRIATSYPATTARFLDRNGVTASIVGISGSVEIAPALKIADVICDLVSTGSTLRSNGLREVQTILESESVLVCTEKALPATKEREIERLLQRLEGVMRAAETKYIMMNAPRAALAHVRRLLPGMENPSIMPLEGTNDHIAIHAVSRETIFWETMEDLKAAGASSILVLPIEKIIG